MSVVILSLNRIKENVGLLPVNQSKTNNNYSWFIFIITLGRLAYYSLVGGIQYNRDIKTFHGGVHLP